MELEPAKARALRESFERSVWEQRRRYEPQVTHAELLAARFELGSVVGVFAREVHDEVPGRHHAIVMSPLLLIPAVIGAAVAGVPGAVPVLGACTIVIPVCIGAAMFAVRPKKWTEWFYAYTGGFALSTGPESDAVPVRWSDVTDVHQVWVDLHHDEAPMTRELTTYSLRLAGGRTAEISRSLENVLDPYRHVGPLLSALSPKVLGQTLPKLPKVDEVIATYTRSAG